MRLANQESLEQKKKKLEEERRRNLSRSIKKRNVVGVKTRTHHIFNMEQNVGNQIDIAVCNAEMLHQTQILFTDKEKTLLGEETLNCIDVSTFEELNFMVGLDGS